MFARKGVKTEGLCSEIRTATEVIEKVYSVYHVKPILIEAVCDNKNLTSYHVMGRAIDITCPIKIKQNIILALKCRLGDRYSVIDKGYKIHIAYIGKLNQKEKH